MLLFPLPLLPPDAEVGKGQASRVVKIQPKMLFMIFVFLLPIVSDTANINLYSKFSQRRKGKEKFFYAFSKLLSPESNIYEVN